MTHRMKHLVCNVASAVLLAAATFSASHAQANSHVWVANNSSSSVLRLYYSSAGRGWGHDRLGDEIIASGQAKRFNVIDSANTCRMDLKAVMSNGREHTRFGIDVCSVYRWNIGNSFNDFDYAD